METLSPFLRNLIKDYEDRAKKPSSEQLLCDLGYLPLLHANHENDRSENWCLVGLLNIDAYSSGIKESN